MKRFIVILLFAVLLCGCSKDKTKDKTKDVGIDSITETPTKAIRKINCEVVCKIC